MKRPVMGGSITERYEELLRQSYEERMAARGPGGEAPGAQLRNFGAAATAEAAAQEGQPKGGGRASRRARRAEAALQAGAGKAPEGPPRGGLGLTWGLDLHPVRWMIAAGLGFSALRAVLQWVAPWPLKLVFDSVLANHRLPGVFAWLPAGHGARLEILSLAMVVIAILLGIAAYGANALLANAGQRVVFDLRRKLFRHLEAQSQAFHHRHPVGDLLSRIGGDVQAMQSVVVNVVPVLFENALTVGGMVTIMFLLDWRYSLIALSLLPVLYWTVAHYMSAIKVAQRRARANEGNATATAQQVLVALPVVQAFGAEDEEARRYSELAYEGLAANRKAVVLQSRFTPLVTTIMTLSSALVVYFGTRSVLQGRLTPGDLLVFMAYLRGLYTPVRQLAKLAGMVGKGHASAERVAEIMRAEEEVKSPPKPLRPASVKGRIELEGVRFSYNGAREALAGIDMEVLPASRHALVGSTGSGKSSLLRLVPRFVDPSAGRILLDGTDLRELDLEWLRSQIALVPQEPSLLRATIWENIAYGRPGASRRDAVAAARAAGVHDVISALPHGYDTVVGERGTAVSGGQRQCVAVARAMARDATILLLDEPTTGLDAETEGILLEALERLSEGRTTLFVTHHLRAIHNADRITVLADGKIAEQGTHDTLLESKTAYWRLQQSAEAIGAGA